MIMTDSNKTHPVLEAAKLLNALDVTEKAGTLAILIEHWQHGLVNELNLENPDKVLERDKDVCYPADVGVDNAGDLASALLALYKVTGGQEVYNTFPDLVEPSIKQTSAMSAALSAFYRLTYSHKLDYLAGIFADAAEGYLFEDKLADDLGISQTGHSVMASIFKYQGRCGFADKPLTEEDKPF